MCLKFNSGMFLISRFENMMDYFGHICSFIGSVQY